MTTILDEYPAADGAVIVRWFDSSYSLCWFGEVAGVLVHNGTLVNGPTIRKYANSCGCYDWDDDASEGQTGQAIFGANYDAKNLVTPVPYSVSWQVTVL